MAKVVLQTGQGVIHYSYHGMQYSSGQHKDELKHYGFEVSITGMIYPCENYIMKKEDLQTGRQL